MFISTFLFILKEGGEDLRDRGPPGETTLVDKVAGDVGGDDGLLVHVGDALHALVEVVSADAGGDVVDEDVEELLVLGGVEVDLGEVGVEVVGELVDLGGDEVRDVREVDLPAHLLVVLEHALGLVLGELLEVLEEVRGELLLDLHELVVVEREAAEDLVGGGDNAALVGRRVAEEDGAAVLEPVAGLLGDVEVGTLDDEAGVELPVGAEEGGDVVDVEGAGAATAGHEDVGLGGVGVAAVDVEGLVGGDPLLDDLAVLLGDAEDLLRERAGLAGLAHAEEPGAVVEELRGEGGDHLAVVDEAHDALPVEALGVVAAARAVGRGEELCALGEVLGEELHAVAGDVTVGATGHLDGEGPVDLGELERVDEVLEDTPGGDAVVLVVDASALLARDEGALGEVAHGDGLGGEPVDEAVVEVLVGAEVDVLGLLEVVDDGVAVLEGVLLVVPDDEGEEGGEEAALVLVHVLEGEALAELLELGLDLLGGLAGGGHLLAGDVELLGEVVVGRDKDDRLGAALGDVLVLLLLGVGEVVALREHVGALVALVLGVAGDDGTHAATGEVAEADVHAEVAAAADKVHAEGELGVLLCAVKAGDLVDVGGVDAEADAELVEAVVVGAEDVVDDVERLEEDGAAAVVVLLEAGVERLELDDEGGLAALVLLEVVLLGVELCVKDVEELDRELLVEAERLEDGRLRVHRGVDLGERLLEDGGERAEEVGLVPGEGALLLVQGGERVLLEPKELEELELTHELVHALGRAHDLPAEVDRPDHHVPLRALVQVRKAEVAERQVAAAHEARDAVEEVVLGRVLPRERERRARRALGDVLVLHLVVLLGPLDELLLELPRHGDRGLGVVDPREAHARDAHRPPDVGELGLRDVLAVLADPARVVVLEDRLVDVGAVQPDHKSALLEVEVDVLLVALAVHKGVAHNLLLVVGKLRLVRLGHVLVEPAQVGAVGAAEGTADAPVDLRPLAEVGRKVLVRDGRGLAAGALAVAGDALKVVLDELEAAARAECGCLE